MQRIRIYICCSGLTPYGLFVNSSVACVAATVIRRADCLYGQNLVCHDQIARNSPYWIGATGPEFFQACGCKDRYRRVVSEQEFVKVVAASRGET